MDRKFIDCITSFDSGFFVFLSCALSLSLSYLLLFRLISQWNGLVIGSSLHSGHCLVRIGQKLRLWNVVENIKKERLLKKRVAKLALVSRSVVDKWQDRIIPFSY